MKKICLLCVLVLPGLASFAAIDTIYIYSNAMHKKNPCVVITPSNYSDSSKHFPVVYLLHGAHGSFDNFVVRMSGIQQMADENQVLIVCPDATQYSWYFDSPVDSTMRYETNIALELPVYIDAHYNTIADRKHRAIAGLSMGGQGALFLAFRHADVFGACGSMSGAINLPFIPKNYGLEKVLGNATTNASYYNDWSALTVIEKYPKDSLAIIIDCGAQDFISFMTKAAHDKMVKLHIPHDYIQRPGRHNWDYWSTAVCYQLLFFRQYFNG